MWNVLGVQLVLAQELFKIIHPATHSIMESKELELELWLSNMVRYSFLADYEQK